MVLTGFVQMIVIQESLNRHWSAKISIFQFLISNFIKQFQGWRCCRKCDPILMMIIMIIMVKWSLLSWWWWGGGKHKRWFYTKYLSRTPNFLSGVKISWLNLIINVRGKWEQGILHYFESVFHFFVCAKEMTSKMYRWVHYK